MDINDLAAVKYDRNRYAIKAKIYLAVPTLRYFNLLFLPLEDLNPGLLIETTPKTHFHH